LIDAIEADRQIEQRRISARGCGNRGVKTQVPLGLTNNDDLIGPVRFGRLSIRRRPSERQKHSGSGQTHVIPL
jgi:hypothetical protein